MPGQPTSQWCHWLTISAEVSWVHVFARLMLKPYHRSAPAGCSSRCEISARLLLATTGSDLRSSKRAAWEPSRVGLVTLVAPYDVAHCLLRLAGAAAGERPVSRLLPVEGALNACGIGRGCLRGCQRHPRGQHRRAHCDDPCSDT